MTEKNLYIYSLKYQSHGFTISYPLYIANINNSSYFNSSEQIYDNEWVIKQKQSSVIEFWNK